MLGSGQAIHLDPLPPRRPTEEAHVEINADGVALWVSRRHVPVEIEGTVDGHPAYFRARGTGWTFTIAETDDAAVWPYDDNERAVLFSREGAHDPDGTGFGAGYMELAVAETLILESVSAFRERRKGEGR